MQFCLQRQSQRHTLESALSNFTTTTTRTHSELIPDSWFDRTDLVVSSFYLVGHSTSGFDFCRFLLLFFNLETTTFGTNFCKNFFLIVGLFTFLIHTWTPLKFLISTNASSLRVDLLNSAAGGIWFCGRFSQISNKNKLLL